MHIKQRQSRLKSVNIQAVKVGKFGTIVELIVIFLILFKDKFIISRFYFPVLSC